MDTWENKCHACMQQKWSLHWSTCTDLVLFIAISWPNIMDALGVEAQEAINLLLTMDPQQLPGAVEVKAMAIFFNLDWDRILETEPAFIPHPDNDMDTSYFDPKNTLQQLKISAVDL
ncbi:serine/threonine-protein kinase greatwall-like isoform X2 [Pomacea canaliculata]|uniref:serine/threonine-protein kinase greatwall-like isoform X2 n=1 Tax=Pomacea canaliculata TaxID=400727 RepID=UPI000D731B54|nr:serine/threonine-protein kinase greatwall-like isoform X2 [Pomacea canaliculata]XP_025106680.1 serine/threonine-protein kinase greatwall-like isoform X2 [Pomacea canaliculata]